MGPLTFLNDTKWILEDQRGNSDSHGIKLESLIGSGLFLDSQYNEAALGYQTVLYEDY